MFNGASGSQNYQFEDFFLAWALCSLEGLLMIYFNLICEGQRVILFSFESISKVMFIIWMRQHLPSSYFCILLFGKTDKPALYDNTYESE